MSNQLLRRVAIGTVLVLVVLVVIRTGNPLPLTLLVATWSILATIEFIRLLSIVEIHLPFWLIPPLNAVTVMTGHLDWLPDFLIVPLALIFSTTVLTQEPKPRVPVYGVFAVIYLGFLPAHLVMLRNLVYKENFSSWLIMFPLILTWVSDTAAYAAGRLAGRHQLAPKISPRKTVEGFVAGLLSGAMLSMTWLRTLQPFDARPIWWLGAVGIAISALGQAGDLFESVFKRAVGVKNSSGFLGEHGGFLDRCDSLLFSIPAFYYLTLLLSTW